MINKNEIRIRIYRQFDGDLFSLLEMGFPVSKMLETCFHEKAKGNRIQYVIKEVGERTPIKNSYIEIKFSLLTEEAVHLKRQITRRNINQFCKLLLRNSITFIPLHFLLRESKERQEELLFLESSMQPEVREVCPRKVTETGTKRKRGRPRKSENPPVSEEKAEAISEKEIEVTDKDRDNASEEKVTTSGIQGSRVKAAKAWRVKRKRGYLGSQDALEESTTQSSSIEPAQEEKAELEKEREEQMRAFMMQFGGI
ncbi:MAG: hypothetical protein Q4B26_02275 [Eubacteriales bacterium]|nr:hypothetical protein [Eubacteriales bacterium]